MKPGFYELSMLWPSNANLVHRKQTYKPAFLTNQGHAKDALGYVNLHRGRETSDLSRRQSEDLGQEILIE
jgi:hypothetical protein